MKKTELKNCPHWLLFADTENEDVEYDINNKIIWNGGTWNGGAWIGGMWNGGTWKSGIWNDGTWNDGIWNDGHWKNGSWFGGTWNGGMWHEGFWGRGVWEKGVWLKGTWSCGEWNGGIWKRGIWHGGTWHNGTWHDGTWYDGIWYDGTWLNGEWHNGTWMVDGIQNSSHRMMHMLFLCGVIFDSDGYGTAYRATRKDCTGLFFSSFIQHEGEFYEEVERGGRETCLAGIHASTLSFVYYFVLTSAHKRNLSDIQLWKVRFKKEDVLGCDGQKIRLRGGFFEKINHPFQV